ncbi:response regulator [Butyrivibrio sp. VCB2006]|uniref:response regulator n=1 Tax=Butyrivibrio sp. VCB2006 TaxID=1280679 RepID=UPI000418F1E8|nr:response regulator [Butyrivibrio sp. VCB2006]
MENGRVDNELKKVSYLLLILAMTILAALIIVLNRILNWELWIIPVIVVGVGLAWTTYVINQISTKMQLYFSGCFFVFLVFYYCMKISAVYDCGTVLVIMILIFSFTREKILTWVGTVSAVFSLIFHLVVRYSENNLTVDLYSVVRTTVIFILVPISAFLMDRIIKAWSTAESNYLQQIEVLQEENTRANNFLANVSHEVRTPISAVIGLSYVLEKEELPEQTMSKVEAISDAGHRVAEQITDILDFTEIDMQKIAVRSENYTISSVINDLLTKLYQTQNYEVELVVDVDSSIPSVLVGDDGKIKRILWHLIRNGLKFTKIGGVYLHIYPIKRDYGINLVMEVKDSGIGMSEDEIENAYEKFYQVDSGRSRSMGGLGLGIPIANGFTAAMDGVLSIESAPGEGTTVTVSIPQMVADRKPYVSMATKQWISVAGFISYLEKDIPKMREFYTDMMTHMAEGLQVPFYRLQTRQELEKLLDTTTITHIFIGTDEYVPNKDYIDKLAKEKKVALLAERDFTGEVGPDITLILKPLLLEQVARFLSQGTEEDKPADSEQVSFPGVKALVVDDEHMNLVVAREIFEAYGMDITTASSGEEAIELCDTQDFDVIFMDHMMPGMDGVEAMKRIRQNASRQSKELCIIALTANAISSAREMFMAEGFDGFAPKPIDIAELERVLKSVLPKNKISYSKEKPKRVKKAKETQAPQKEVDPIAVLKEKNVDTDYGIDYCGGDKEFYFELLQEYVDKKEEKIEVINNLLETSNIKDYEVRVHGVKSTSKLIGALELSEKARLLEMAAKSSDEGYIKDNHKAFIDEYEELMNTIAALFT